jgi:general secretion pathway protein J
MSRQRPQRFPVLGVAAGGFTLVEVLVALFVMSLMAGMAWQGVSNIAIARDVSQQRLDTLLRAQTVLAQWEQDLAMVQDSQSVQPLVFDGATLRITRRQPEGLQVVAWSLRGAGLWRWAGPVVTSRRELQDQWLQSLQLMGNESGQLLTLDGIVSWQLFCWRGNSWSNCQSTGDVAAPAAPGAGTTPPGGTPAGGVAQQLLPGGVRLVLGFGAPGTVSGSLSGSVTRDVALSAL